MRTGVGWFAAVVVVGAGQAMGQTTLYDNGSLVTAPGMGSGGADISEAAPTQTAGYNWNQNPVAAESNRMADDFVVAAGGWNVGTIRIYVYSTGWTNLTSSPVSAASLRIWDGDPTAPGSQVVFGDVTTNRIAASGWANMYRVTAGDTVGSTRPVYWIDLNVGTTLPEGDYWFDVGGALVTGATSGPWIPYTYSSVGFGNAKQRVAAGWTTNSDNADTSFIVMDTAGGTLHDNGTLVSNPGGHSTGADMSEIGPGGTLFGSSFLNNNFNLVRWWMADDFTVTDPEGWDVDSLRLYAYSTGWTNLTSAPISAVSLRIWSGDPSQPGATLVFGDETTNRLTSAQFANMYRIFSGAAFTDTARAVFSLDVAAGVHLPPGTYWYEAGCSPAAGATSGPWMPVLTQAFGTGNAMEYGVPANGAPGWALTTEDTSFLVRGEIGGGCPADFDGNGSLSLNDFVQFRNAYVAGDLAADFDGNGSLTLNDFVTFRNAYVAGCP